MKLRRLRSNWDRLDRDDVRRLQATRLQRYLRDVVVPFSTYYRALFKRCGVDPRSIRSLDDLRRLPFTSKADLQDTPDRPGRARDFIVVPDPKIIGRRPRVMLRAALRGRRRVRNELEYEYRPVLMTSTTGRSADPVPFVHTRHDIDNLSLAGRRLIRVSGATQQHRFMNLFPYAPHLAFWQAHYATTTGGIFCVSTGGGRAMGTEKNIRLMERIRPNGVIAMPTFLYHLLHMAAEQGRRIEGLEVLVLGGEKVPEGMRRKLRELAEEVGSPNVRVLGTYAFTEAKMAWAECDAPADRASPGYHLYPDLGIVEVVDPSSGEPVPDGHPGEIVFTPLDSRGSVVVRYRTGDLIDGGLTYEPCPSCGRTAPRLVGSISRVSQMRTMRLDKVKGTLVDFNELEHVLDDMDHIGAWQLELRKLDDDPMEVDQIVLHVNPRTSMSDDEVVAALHRRFALRTELRLNEIRLHTAEDMRRLQGVGKELKEIRIVDHRVVGTSVSHDRAEA